MYEEKLAAIRGKLEAAGLLPLERQAQRSMEVMRERLDTVLPWAMAESGIDLWLVMGKENGEPPIFKTMLTWDMPHARRNTILAFSYDRSTGKARAMSIGMQSPEMAKLYENALKPGETPWQCVARLVEELQPERIGVERSDLYGFCDGLTETFSNSMRAALGEAWWQRVCSAEDLSVRWLQRVTDTELQVMETLTEVTQDIIDLTFHSDNFQMGVTTTSDLEWIMRNTINRLGFDFWFGPDIDLQRRGGTSSRMFEEVIQPGDLLHCDIGIVGRFIQLHTDIQRLAYVLQPGETQVPASLATLLKKGNQLQDIVAANFKLGTSGNDVFTASIAQAKAAGLKPMVYTHPVGTFGHGAGPMVGRYDQQCPIAGTGERPVENDTCYALELNIHDDLDIWDNQEIFIYLEEDIYFHDTVRFVHGRQTEIIPI